MSRTALLELRTAACASPGSPGRRTARTRTAAPMGMPSHSRPPRTSALWREAHPSTAVTARVATTVVRREPGTTRGSVSTVPVSATARPSPAARARGSAPLLHRPAVATTSTATATSTVSRRLARADPMAEPLGAPAPGRGSSRWRGGWKRRALIPSGRAAIDRMRAAARTRSQARSPDRPTAQAAPAQAARAGGSSLASNGAGAASREEWLRRRSGARRAPAGPSPGAGGATAARRAVDGSRAVLRRRPSGRVLIRSPPP